MSINYTELFTLLGKIGKTVNEINTARGSDVPALVTDLHAAYDNLENLTVGLENTNQSSAAGAFSGLVSSLVSLAQKTVVFYVNEDNPQPDENITTALNELIRQMTADSESIQENSLSAGIVSAGSNIGAGAVSVSLKNRFGVDLQMALAEDLVISCSADSYTGGRTVGVESFQVRGERMQAPITSPVFPSGSGSNAVASVIDALSNSVVANGVFEDFSVSTTSNIPDEWEGISTTQIFHEESVFYAGESSLAFTDGAENPLIAQPFDGTPAHLTPLTQYSFNVWVSADAAPIGGTLTISLYDLDEEQTMADYSGTANSVSLNLDTLTDEWSAFTGVFRTPRILSSEYQLRIGFDSIPAGRTIYLDSLSLGTMTELYPNGPWLAIHSGAEPFVLNDEMTLTISNNYGGGWQKMCERLFALNQKRLVIPSSGSPTLADSLLT